MTEQEKMEYLTKKGWSMVNRNQWTHKKKVFRWSTEAAYLMQKQDDEKS